MILGQDEIIFLYYLLREAFKPKQKSVTFVTLGEGGGSIFGSLSGKWCNVTNVTLFPKRDTYICQHLSLVLLSSLLTTHWTPLGIFVTLLDTCWTALRQSGTPLNHLWDTGMTLE